jgi:hypothetical protein
MEEYTKHTEVDNPLIRTRRWIRVMNPLRSCLRCGRRFLRQGREFMIPCVEGRIVRVEVCRACAKVIAGDITTPLRIKERRVAA